MHVTIVHMQMERSPHNKTGKAIDEYEEYLYEVVKDGNTSEGALTKLRDLYLKLENLWVLRGERKKAQWEEVAPSVDVSMRDGAIILGKHGMINEDIGK